VSLVRAYDRGHAAGRRDAARGRQQAPAERVVRLLGWDAPAEEMAAATDGYREGYQRERRRAATTR